MTQMEEPASKIKGPDLESDYSEYSATLDHLRARFSHFLYKGDGSVCCLFRGENPSRNYCGHRFLTQYNALYPDCLRNV